MARASFRAAMGAKKGMRLGRRRRCHATRRSHHTPLFRRARLKRTARQTRSRRVHFLVGQGINIITQILRGSLQIFQPSDALRLFDENSRGVNLLLECSGPFEFLAGPELRLAALNLYHEAASECRFRQWSAAPRSRSVAIESRSPARKRHDRSPQRAKKCGVSERINPEGGEHVSGGLQGTTFAVPLCPDFEEQRASKFAQRHAAHGLKSRQMLRPYMPDGLSNEVLLAPHRSSLQMIHIDRREHIRQEQNVMALGETQQPVPILQAAELIVERADIVENAALDQEGRPRRDCAPEENFGLKLSRLQGRAYRQFAAGLVQMIAARTCLDVQWRPIQSRNLASELVRMPDVVGVRGTQ